MNNEIRPAPIPQLWKQQKNNTTHNAIILAYKFCWIVLLFLVFCSIFFSSHTKCSCVCAWRKMCWTIWFRNFYVTAVQPYKYWHALELNVPNATHSIGDFFCFSNCSAHSAIGSNYFTLELFDNVYFLASRHSLFSDSSLFICHWIAIRLKSTQNAMDIHYTHIYRLQSIFHPYMETSATHNYTAIAFKSDEWEKAKKGSRKREKQSQK